MNQFKEHWNSIQELEDWVNKSNDQLDLARSHARDFLRPRIEKLGELSKDPNLVPAALDSGGSLFHFKMTEEGVEFTDYWTCEITFVLQNRYLDKHWEQTMIADKKAGLIIGMTDDESQEAKERLELARLKRKYEV